MDFISPYFYIIILLASITANSLIFIGFYYC